MWDFLGFPEEYQVKKKLDRDKFLRSANLTECEQRKLGLNLERINLLYDIRFPDSSEMMVLETTENIRLGRIGYRLKEYVRGIAQSFPYYCLVIIRYMNSVKILLPIERKNKTDDRRMYVEHMIATGLIRTDCENYDATLILSAMRESIAQSHSAAELCLRWSWDIQKAFGKEFSRVSANDETYRYERETLDKENWNNRIFQNAISVDEAEPGVTPDRITGRIFEGYPADVRATPMNWAVCRNLTMDGVDMDVPVNLLFKWEDIKQIKPGDGVQLYDKLILVEDVYGEEITSPGLIAINGGKYFFRHHPALYGGGTLGWGTTEEDCMFVYDLYFSAHTIVRDVHVDFNFPERFSFVDNDVGMERTEFVEKYSGKKFMATCSYGTASGLIWVETPDADADALE